MKEDLKFLSEWTRDVQEDIKSVSRIKSADEIMVFMIGNTANSDTNLLPYRTPLRKIVGGYVLGSVVFTQTQAIILASIVDGLVDYIFIDAEKKLVTIPSPDLEPFEFFNLSHFRPIKSVEYGNISRACIKVIDKTPVYEYKANDITIEATWHFLIEKYTDLSGKNIVIIGAGNTGSKLALKLVECGSSISLVTNNSGRTNKVVEGLNKIKHKGVISEIKLKSEIDNSIKNVDAIIGCTNSFPVITSDMISKMNHSGVVIDLGKGTIEEDAINECIKRKIQTWRVDISALVNSMVSSSRSMSQLVNKKFGRKVMPQGFGLISGGFIGKKYDVIVDSYQNPRSIIGVVEKPGKIMIELDSQAKQNIESTRAIITRDKN